VQAGFLQIWNKEYSFFEMNKEYSFFEMNKDSWIIRGPKGTKFISQPERYIVGV
jgi:hypothetical protein